MTPADALALIQILDALPPAARRELLARYCADCGEIKPERGGCTCRRDE